MDTRISPLFIQSQRPLLGKKQREGGAIDAFKDFIGNNPLFKQFAASSIYDVLDSYRNASAISDTELAQKYEGLLLKIAKPGETILTLCERLDQERSTPKK